MLLPLVAKDLTVWWLDNLINLQLQWSIFAILLITVGIKHLRKVTIPLSVIYVSIILFNFNFLYISNNNQLTNNETLKIAQLNIQYGNPNLEKLIYEIGQSDYDAIVLQEVGDDVGYSVLQLKKIFPYSAGTGPLEGFPSGMAIFSRWPIINKKIHYLDNTETHIIEAIIQSPKMALPVHLFTLHPGSPRNNELWKLRNDTLNYLSKQVSSSLLPYKIILGDVNISPWSPIFKQLIKTSILKNSANGFGYIPSWSYSDFNIISRIVSSAYIDHCLVSDAFNIINKQYLRIDGSDHVLVTTELGL